VPYNRVTVVVAFNRRKYEHQASESVGRGDRRSTPIGDTAAQKVESRRADQPKTTQEGTQSNASKLLRNVDRCTWMQSLKNESYNLDFSSFLSN